MIICVILKNYLLAAADVSCEIIFIEWTWNDRTRNFDTCYPDIDKVDDKNFALPYALNKTVLAVNIRDKPEVKYLPTNLFKTFLNLIAFQAFNCSLIAVENHFHGLSKMRHLHLDRNKIDHIADDAFVDLVSLESLDLSNNRIFILGEHIFDSLKEVESIYLTSNRIEFLPHKIFGSLSRLEKINLNKNIVSEVDENIFENATRLKDVFFTANRLEIIPKNLFQNNLKLENIHLDVNDIKFIDYQMFDHLSSLDYVALQNNQCINSYFYKNEFDKMKRDLQEKCSENIGT